MGIFQKAIKFICYTPSLSHSSRWWSFYDADGLVKKKAFIDPLFINGPWRVSKNLEDYSWSRNPIDRRRFKAKAVVVFGESHSEKWTTPTFVFIPSTVSSAMWGTTVAHFEIGHRGCCLTSIRQNLEQWNFQDFLWVTSDMEGGVFIERASLNACVFLKWSSGWDFRTGSDHRQDNRSGVIYCELFNVGLFWC